MTRLLSTACSSLLLALCACSPSNRIGRTAERNVLSVPVLRTAHVGISIFEPATGKTWYDHQGDRYFVPASNTKIPTCYAAMKYLGDSLVGLRWMEEGDVLYIQPAGDPTFLHPDFPSNRILEFLRQNPKANISIDIANWRDARWGSGWSWNDYDAAYMAERSSFPIYGNTVRFGGTREAMDVRPRYFRESVSFDSTRSAQNYLRNASRDIAENRFRIQAGGEKPASFELPFVTEGPAAAAVLLQDTLRKGFIGLAPESGRRYTSVIRSQPTDSLLKPLMHRSDNFFAEQALLMVSNERLGFMSDARIIDTILKTDFADLPQKPRWVDGSGLSRYNLFSPRDFVAILDKMRREFGMDRIRAIFPTGNEGTLRNYYVAESGQLFAKTGTLSGVVALSGYLYTKKGKLLLFSVLVNNHNGSATDVRRAVEGLIREVRNRY